MPQGGALADPFEPGYPSRLWEAWKDFEKAKGELSGVELARRVSRRLGETFDHSTLSRIKNRQRKATVEELYGIAIELGVSPAWLAFGIKEGEESDIKKASSKTARSAKTTGQRLIHPNKGDGVKKRRNG